jgi:hypothetical protein
VVIPKRQFVGASANAGASPACSPALQSGRRNTASRAAAPMPRRRLNEAHKLLEEISNVLTEA